MQPCSAYGNSHYLTDLYSAVLQLHTQYYIRYCTGYTDFSTTYPHDLEKVWTITKGDTALTIACNGVETC